jgi:16S rRNA (cytosine967-C5)-methyltransferase
VTTPARRCAYVVLRRTFEDGAYTDRALYAEAARLGLAGRDLRFATALAFGAVQRAATLDHVITKLAGRDAATLDAPVLAALRLGLHQLAFMDGVADHAAVGESVELAKEGGANRGAAGLVNAVLRRGATEARPIVAGLGEETAAEAGVKYSYPEWLAAMWFAMLGPGEARALMRACNEPAESSLRVNTLVATVEEVREELDAAGVATSPVAEIPEALVLEAPFDVHGSEVWARGAVMPQSRAAMLPARLLDPQPGERVLDLCAAPGGKTSQLAALMGGRGTVVAVERNEARARELAATCERMHAGNVEVVVADAREPLTGDRFDRVLVDPPCSGLGTLRSRPDQRWRSSPERIAALTDEQAAIAGAGADALAPGGSLVYSTCTISAAEGQGVVDRTAGSRDDLWEDDLRAVHPLWENPVRDHLDLQLMPHRDGTDGFYIARLHRVATHDCASSLDRGPGNPRRRRSQ